MDVGIGIQQIIIGISVLNVVEEFALLALQRNIFARTVHLG